MGYVSVWPVGQHKRPYQLLAFSAAAWNEIHSRQIAMCNKLTAQA
jgi:hypothetical protein